MRRTFVAVACFIGAVGAAVEVAACATPLVSLVVQPTSEAFALGGSVAVQLLIENRSEHDVIFDLGPDSKENLEFLVTRPDGLQSTGRWRQGEDLATPGKHRLAPGDRYEQRLVLNEWITFDQTGEYVIAVSLVTPILIPGSASQLCSSTFHIHIVQDHEKLLELCRRLAERSQSPGMEIRKQAATALSHVADPICTPILADLLRSEGAGSWGAARGLARIGTPEALDLLIGALSSDDYQLYDAAAAALVELLNRTEERTLRMKILQAFQEAERPKPGGQ